MANPTFKEFPVRKYVGFSDEQWKPIRKWIRAQRPKISEAEGLRLLTAVGMDQVADVKTYAAYLKERFAEQPTRKRADP